MSRWNWWRIGGGAAIVAGLALVLLAAGRADASFGSIFRQAWTGLAVAALGVGALVADQLGEEDGADECDEG